MKNTKMLAVTLSLAALMISACTGDGDSSTSSSGGSTSSSGSTSTSSSSGGSSGSTSSSSGSTSGGSFTCDSKSKCPKEPAQDKAGCEQVLAGQCGAEFKALGDCGIANETCAADGTSDTKTTNAGPCKTQSDAFTKCFGGG